MIFCADHFITRLTDRVVHCKTRDCHQYFTLRKPPGQAVRRVVACDGLGYVHPGHVENYLPASVEQAIERLLSRNGNRSNTHG